MDWKPYSHLSNTHAFLSASRHHWINYEEDKLVSSFMNYQRVAMGTKIHKFAEDAIKLGVRLPDTTATLHAFVNDAIGYNLSPEVVLYYSPYAYGTADAIGYDAGVLRIHDLKTGVTPGSIDQLMVYAAYFLLDYKEKPNSIWLRIYQNDEIVEYDPSIQEVQDISDKIVAFDKILTALEHQQGR